MKKFKNLVLFGFVLILILISATNQRCSEGCLKCEGNNICSLCDAASLYVMINGECIKQNLEFCLFTFNLNSCLVCYPGFYLEISGKCVKNPTGVNQITNCKEYESYTRCKSCYQYYYIIDEGRGCEKISSDPIENCIIYQADKQCKVCGDYIISPDGSRCDLPQQEDKNCMFYSDTTSCSECQDEYYFDKNYYIRHIEDFYQSLLQSRYTYYLNQHSLINVPVCEKKTLIQNCEIPLGNHKCELCKEGYFINESKNECIVEPEPTVFFRTDNITNCYLHNRTMVTRNNEQVENIECILCYEGFYKSINNRKCMQHSSKINYCQIMSQSIDKECLLCIEGYYREDGENDEKCKERTDVNENCGKYHILSEACEECKDETYILHNNNKYCSAPIEFCKLYNVTGPILSCKQCDFGYYFKIETGQCLKNDVFDPYCAFYDELQVCQECYFGFYYDESIDPPTCQPNSSEYVDRARCDGFHPLNYNECKTCLGNKTLLNIAYTCKMYNPEFKDIYSKYTMITYCKTFTMSKGEEFKCIEPLDEIMNDDESQKHLFVLYTNEEKAYDRTYNKIQYCEKHKNIYNNPSETITCDKCFDIRFIETEFEYDNIGELSNCNEDETDYGYCVKYLSEYSQCREYTYWNYKKYTCNNQHKACWQICFFGCITFCGDKCPYCPWHNDCSSSTYEITYNTCYGQGWSNDYCISKDNFGNCNVFEFFQYGMGVRFKEHVPYEIVISPDKTKCLPYDSRQFENNNNCIQNSDDDKFCLLCKKGFYSIPYQIFSYEKDSIESYVAKINVDEFVPKCIKFNNINKICSECAPGYFLSRNECMVCNDRNIAISPDGVSCVQFVDEVFVDTCNKIGLVGTLNYCIECKPDYVAEINWDENQKALLKYFPMVDGVQTRLVYDSELLTVNKCIDNNDLFYYQEDIKESIKNCLFYEIYDEVTYCMGCKFGFTGIVYKTPNNFLTVQNCDVDDDCNTGITYPLLKPHISNLVTCHTCTDDSNIPSYYFFYTTYRDVSKAEFIYEPTTASKKTMKCLSPTISNCLIQFVSADPMVIEKWNGYSTVCVYCKPKTHPSYTSTQSDFFPYEYVTSCDPIPDCHHSRIPGECEECLSDVSNPQYNNLNLIPGSGTNTCQQNDYIQQDPFCKTTLDSSISGSCLECKDGYVYLNFKCIPLNITSCKYFQGNTCVDSEKELDENKSIIWREFNSDYTVESVNCIEVTEAIENCEYYISETECHQCASGYSLGFEGKFCFEATVSSCTAYDNKTGSCTSCQNNFNLSSSGACIPVNTTPNFRGCAEYSDDICRSCTEEGFSPIYINANKTNICINSTVVEFCEEIDEEMLLINKTLSCKKCKSFNKYKDLPEADDFEINNYDFYVIGEPEYASDNDLKKASQIWDYYEDFNTEIRSKRNFIGDGVRFALFKYDYDVCHEFSPIENCKTYDDATFENTFDCIECEDAYFLANNVCNSRTIIPFCTEYYIDKDECKLFVDSWNYSIQFSTFDLYVMSNAPPIIDPIEYPIEGIEGCISYWDTNTCKYCNTTTFLYDNLCLTVNNVVADCEIYSRDGLCIKCKGDLLLFQNKCLRKYSTNCSEYLSNTSCGQCPVEYPYIAQGSCMKNPEIDNCNIYSNKNSCLKCDNDYFRNQSNHCVLHNYYIPNCKKHLEGPFCYECEENYVLINNECILNPNYDRHCKLFETTSRCQVCDFNYYFKLGQCVKCKTDSFSCYFCDPDNPNLCLLCKTGFFMNNEKECVPVPAFTQPLIKLYQESISSKFVYLNKRFALLSLLILFLF